MQTNLYVGVVLAMCAVTQPIVSAYAQPSMSQPPLAATPVQRVAVVRLSYSGNVPPGHRESFEARLVEGLAAAAFQVMSGPPVERKLATANLANCADGDCYPHVAQTLDVGYLLVGKVDESNKNYDVTLDLINGRTGAAIGKVHERCETCGMAEAAERVGLASAALRKRLEALSSTPAHVVLQSYPSGATAWVNGNRVGQTPAGLELPGGQHRLLLELDGYHKTERNFTIVSGVDETINVELLRPPSEFPYKLTGWVAVVSGAALMVAGGYAAYIDGKVIACSNNEKDINGLCPKLRDTDLLAALLVGAGAATATLGGISLWVGSQQSSAQQAHRASGSRHDVGLRLSGTF